MNFNQKDNITIKAANGKPLKYVDSFEISSIEKDIKIRIAKAWTALNKMQVIWKSNLCKDLKLLQSCCRVHFTIWLSHMDAH